MLMLDATTSRSTGFWMSASRSDAGTDVVDGGVLRHLVHALADPDHRSEVKDGVDAVERTAHGVRIAHVTDLQLDVVGEIARPAAVGVHLLGQHVEHAHAVAACEQARRRGASR